MNITELFNQKRTVFSLEIFPPKKSSSIDTIYDTVEQLSTLQPDFISVTYGAGGNLADNSTCEIAAKIKDEFHIEPLAHLTCVNSSYGEVTEMINRLQNAGIENVLALRGDINPQITPKEDFKHANELVIALQRQSRLNIVGACYPEGHYQSESLEADIQNLKYKIGAGASLLITQLFFDNNLFYSYVKKVRAAGITVPISAGIMPIVSKRQIERTVALSGSSLPHSFTAMISKYENDPEGLFEAGIDFAAHQIIDLVQHNVQGIHLYTMNNPSVAKAVYKKTEQYL
ncbi:MAG: methylenetetrahydrofolate reductase [NAD(P)H] [Oscillospiraceae bacterium]|nr:methylenetetrahydrofolate reductase [NAD(P)H] [Oscillospiraceae bacterium]